MWGLESMFGKRVEKQYSSDGAAHGGGGSAAAAVEEAAKATDAAIAKAKLTGDAHIANLHNPNQYGADVSVGPRTAVLKPAGVAEGGSEDLQIRKETLEAALENPVELGGPAISKPADAVRAAARAESFYIDPKQVEAALVSGGLPEPIKIQKVAWQPDMFVEPKTKPLSPTPMGTVADLRTAGKTEGVESDWKAAQRAAKVDNPEGLKSLRTPDGVQGVENDWKAAKRAVEGSKSPVGLGEFRIAPKDLTTKREVVGAGLGEKRKAELRRNAERLILDLRKLIDATKDAVELKSMSARLAMAEKFYDENFK